MEVAVHAGMVVTGEVFTPLDSEWTALPAFMNCTLRTEGILESARKGKVRRQIFDDGDILIL